MEHQPPHSPADARSAKPPDRARGPLSQIERGDAAARGNGLRDRLEDWSSTLIGAAAGLRPKIEIGVALLLLVVLFRAFLAGGYMIETGSMAPCLLGYHKQAECPACRYRFAVDGTLGTGSAVCPNCGQEEIDVDSLLLNDGDHLLVARPSFEFLNPRRWNVIVFANPSRPRQAYVKRLAGLPGELVQIKSGDLYVDGEIQTKDLRTQRSMRILVYDHAFPPLNSDPEWQPRWVIETPRAGWSERGGSFLFAPSAGAVRPEPQESEIREWVGYRHWIRSGGKHRTSVQLVDWPAALSPSLLLETPLSYVDSTHTLICSGALSRELRDRLDREAASVAFRQSLSLLYEASHVAPIRDVYGYNHTQERAAGNDVRDLMFSAQVALRGEPGVFAISMSDGRLAYRCEFDTDRQEIRLIDELLEETMRTAPLPASLKEGARIEMSLWDRQALLAVDGEIPFEPVVASAAVGRGQTPWQPVKFGARNLRAEVREVQLFRDVYYTDNQGDRGVSKPLRLGKDEYFVLGDNSPVSKDSRGWNRQTVLRRDLLTGKPLIVHLPSRRKRIGIGSWQTEIRIPEPSRVRYIH